MQHSLFLLSALLVSALLGFPLAAQQVANVGDQVPDVTFPQFLNGDGRQSLAEFYGSPVVIDLWGTR